MSEPEKKSSSSKIAIIFVIAFILIGIGYFISINPADDTEALSQEIAIQEQRANEIVSEDDAIEQTAEALSETPIQENITVGPSSKAIYALSERILGDVNAPVKISEFSSFSCGHCASFHRETFPAFKTSYVDTGRAYLVFSDFPLNGPAMHASMITRCAPKAQYFEFVQDLFVNQDEWAFDASSYQGYLKTKAAQYGVDGEMFKACINNEEIKTGIMEKMKAAQAQWEITSTPSFVVNNKTAITGNQPFKAFVTQIAEAANDVTFTQDITPENNTSGTTE